MGKFGSTGEGEIVSLQPLFIRQQVNSVGVFFE